MKEKKDIKLYFAILNKGWLRREFTSTQLPAMNKTVGVKLFWEEPSKTWGHPIYSNRNAIVRRFLKTDCDFLIMQDDDIVPNHNPAELVFADKDVIGSPAKVRTRHGTLDWVAYVMHPTLGGYASIDMGAAPTDADLVPVDIVGTGLICIKRRVLEAIKAPFTVENDEDGVCEWGTDFAFCKRAKKAGFEVFTTPHRVCEHIKEMGFNDMDGYDDSDFRDRSNDKYEMAWGEWAIQQQDWLFIKQSMQDYGVETVVEFGSGLSSLLMSETAGVISYETSVDWAKKIEDKRKPENKLRVLLWDGVSEPTPPCISTPDMVFIDGPVGLCNGGPGRAVSYAYSAMLSPKIIITHDSGRAEEVEWARRYFHGKYQIVGKNGNHQQGCILWKRMES